MRECLYFLLARCPDRHRPSRVMWMQRYGIPHKEIRKRSLKLPPEYACSVFRVWLGRRACFPAVYRKSRAYQLGFARYRDAAEPTPSRTGGLSQNEDCRQCIESGQVPAEIVPTSECRIGRVKFRMLVLVQVEQIRCRRRSEGFFVELLPKAA